MCYRWGRGRTRVTVPSYGQVSNSSGERDVWDEIQENFISSVGIGRGRHRAAPYLWRWSINEPENTQTNSNTIEDDSIILPPISPVEQRRYLLDYADKTLQTACQIQNVQFQWPNCSSGRSFDEDEQNQLNRRRLLRKFTSKSKNCVKINIPLYPKKNPQIFFKSYGNQIRLKQ